MDNGTEEKQPSKSSSAARAAAAAKAREAKRERQRKKAEDVLRRVSGSERTEQHEDSTVQDELPANELPSVPVPESRTSIRGPVAGGHMSYMDFVRDVPSTTVAGTTVEADSGPARVFAREYLGPFARSNRASRQKHINNYGDAAGYFGYAILGALTGAGMYFGAHKLSHFLQQKLGPSLTRHEDVEAEVAGVSNVVKTRTSKLTLSDYLEAHGQSGPTSRKR